MRGGFGRLNGPGFRGFGAGAPAGSGIPANAGGNAVSGKGIDFMYATPAGVTVNHGTTSGAQIIQFDNNSTFLWLRTVFTSDVAEAQVTASTIPIPFITVQITDTGNGMSFMNAAIPVYAIAGIQPGLPYILPTPQLIQPNASYQFTFANYDAAVNYANVRMILQGFRIFSTGLQSIAQAMQLLNG